MFNQVSKDYSPEHMNRWLTSFLNKGMPQRNQAVDPNWKFKGNCHFVPQYEYVYLEDNHTKACNVVISYSNLSEGFREIGKAFGKNWSLEQHHRIPGRAGGAAAKKNSPQKKDFLAKNDLHMMNQSSLSPRLKSMIRYLYRSDYELLSEFF